jgi:deazaflavin-dependent oxidoreductase (nitroreductase family)
MGAVCKRDAEPAGANRTRGAEVPEMHDWNRQVIEHFRANKGKVGGNWEGRPLLLLTTTGAKSGQKRTNPVMYLREGGRLFVFASKGGAPTHPAWYHNLLAHPDVTVEIGDETFPATAESVTGAEHDKIYARWAQMYPQFGEYQVKTTRTIPVIELQPHTA